MPAAVSGSVEFHRKDRLRRKSYCSSEDAKSLRMHEAVERSGATQPEYQGTDYFLRLYTCEESL
ncbi:MAG: hypothetical protein H6Q06_1042 [Acidobacteria bacterium]|jgi:hypothetical protein|nr:hypothetical protein [Acidobacteriota bacterium]